MEGKLNSDFTLANQQQFFILRLPEDLADRVRALLKASKKETTDSGPSDTLPTQIDVKPQDPKNPSNDFIFVLEGTEYPALLMNLPTPLEAHKTLDNKIFLKAADIGQILQVFKKEKEREIMKSKICKTPYGDYAPSGITPPTQDIVKKRFEFTRMNDNDTFIPYQIRQITDEITSFGSTTTTTVTSVTAGGGESKAPTTTKKRGTKKEQPEKEKAGGTGGGGGPGATNEEKGQEQRKVERVIEEVVDFEEWMIDPTNPNRGRTLVFDGLDWTTQDAALLLMHQLLMTEEDREEDELEELTQQQLRNKNNKQLTDSGARGEEKVNTDAPAASSSAGLSLNLSRGGGGGEGESAAPFYPDEIETGPTSRMKLSFTFKRTPSTGSRAGGVGVASGDMAEGTDILGGLDLGLADGLPGQGQEGLEEEKYQLEAEGENMEQDDAAMVADDVENDQYDDEEEEEDEEDEDDDLEDLILAKQKASQSALNEGEGGDGEAMAVVEEDLGIGMGTEDQQQQQVGLTMEEDGDEEFDLPRHQQQHHQPAQFQAGDEDSDEDEEWMKGV